MVLFLMRGLVKASLEYISNSLSNETPYTHSKMGVGCCKYIQ